MSAEGAEALRASTAAQSGRCFVTLRVLSIPADTPPTDKLYVAGSFNGWNAKDDAYELLMDEQGAYSVHVASEIGAVLEYKFTRGSWDTVETVPGAEIMANRRSLVEASGQEITASIGDWHDRRDDLAARGGVKGTIETIRAFPIPQLGGARRVWVYLPHDYATSDRRYPVIYMHDGQNLFDAATSFSGGWDVAEAMWAERANRDAILVAPDSAGESRVNEHSPWRDEERGAGGQGDTYVDFLVQTLKPYIDVRFRTLRDRQYTGVVGSSMGGLISLYAALKHPGVFGRVGAFSSAFGFARRRIFDVVREWGREGKLLRAGRTQIYFFVGERGASGAEGEKSRAEDTIEMFHLLQRLGFSADDLELKLDDCARHAEATWARVFGPAYLWLFGGG